MLWKYESILHSGNRSLFSDTSGRRFHYLRPSAGMPMVPGRHERSKILMKGVGTDTPFLAVHNKQFRGKFPFIWVAPFSYWFRRIDFEGYTRMPEVSVTRHSFTRWPHFLRHDAPQAEKIGIVFR